MGCLVFPLHGLNILSFEEFVLGPVFCDILNQIERFLCHFQRERDLSEMVILAAKQQLKIAD